MPSTYTGSSDTGAFSADVPIGNDPRNSASVRTPMMKILDLLAGLRNRAWNGATKWAGAHEFDLGLTANKKIVSAPTTDTEPTIENDTTPTGIDPALVFRLTAGPPARYYRSWRSASGDWWETVNASYNNGTGQWAADDMTVDACAIRHRGMQVVFYYKAAGVASWASWDASSAQAPYHNAAVGDAYEFSGGVRIGTGGSTGIATPTPAVNRGELWRANVPLAVAEVDINGNLVEGFNIANIAHPGAGQYDFTLGTGASRLLPVVTPIAGDVVPLIIAAGRTGTTFSVSLSARLGVQTGSDNPFIVHVFGF